MIAPAATALKPASALSIPAIEVGPMLPASSFAEMRRRMLLDGCKWDPQVEDVATLTPFPLLISQQTASVLAHLAEQLAAELTAAEAEISIRPALLRHLGMPRTLRGWMQQTATQPLPPERARVIRFDFHATRNGWRISEANADVPGGYGEAGLFPRLMAAATGAGAPAGDPGDALAAAIAGPAESAGEIVLLSAAGFMEDHQVVGYLARRLIERGVAVRLGDPTLLQWQGDRAVLRSGESESHPEAIVRFVQAEWLARLPRRLGCSRLFVAGSTPVVNGPLSPIGESKRLPLVFDRLRTAMPTWQRLLPETRSVRSAPWRQGSDWVIKSAYCNTGDDVCVRGDVPERKWRRAARHATLRPHRWLAQRRFEPMWLDTPAGPAHACLGVYTVNGRAAGIYGRLSTRAFVDYRAADVAVLVKQETT